VPLQDEPRKKVSSEPGHWAYWLSGTVRAISPDWSSRRPGLAGPIAAPDLSLAHRVVSRPGCISAAPMMPTEPAARLAAGLPTPSHPVETIGKIEQFLACFWKLCLPC